MICFMCMDVLPGCTSSNHLHAWCPERLKDVSDPLELELQMAVSWELRPGPLKEPVELSHLFSLLDHVFFTCSYADDCVG